MEAIALLLVVIFSFTIVKSITETRAKERADRMRVIEKAIQSGQLDPQTIEQLTWGMSGQRRPKSPVAPGQARRPRGTWLLALGWITLFAGIGIMGLGGLVNGDEAIGAGALVSVIGFGVTTYPFALRELEARRGSQS